MKKYIYIILCLFSQVACSNRIDQKNISLIGVLADAQYFDTKMLIPKYIGSTTKIAFRENYKMYIVLRRRNYTNDVFDAKNNTITSTVIKVDTFYHYNVIKNGSKTGLVYGRDKHDPLVGQIFYLDTLLKYQTMDNESYQGLSLDLGKPDQTIEIGKTKKVEKFLFKKTVIGDPDSIYRYYDTKYKNLDFTFSPALDKQSDSKLVKIQYVYKPTQAIIDNRSIEIPRLEMNWTTREVEFSKELINKYFDKFIKENK